MKIKYFVFVAVIAIAFLACLPAGRVLASCLEQNFAQKTDADKIQCLTSVVADLTQQITQLQTQQQTQSITAAPATSCRDFNNNLGFANSFTSEVTKLHEILKKENVSYGEDEENEYTQDTADAVTQFQRKHGIIPASGYVGSITRAKINELYGCEKNKSSASLSQTVPRITLISPNGPNEVFENTNPKIDVSWDSVGLLPTDKITIWLVDYSGLYQKRLLIVRDVPGDRKEYSGNFYGPTPGEKFKVALQVVRGIGSLPGDESDNYFTIVTSKELSGPVIEIFGSSKIVKGVNASWTVRATDNRSGGLTLSVDWGDGQTRNNIIYGYEDSVVVEKTYANEGNYTAIFSVRNNLGQITKLTKVISVFSSSSLITADVTSVSLTSFRADKSDYTPGETIKFSVVALDQDGNYLSPSSGVKLYLNTIDPTNKTIEEGEMQYVGAGSYKFEITILIFDNIPGLWSTYVTAKKNDVAIGTGGKTYYNIKKVVATTQCEDSDGMDYYVKGTVTYLGSSSTDFCNSGGVVKSCLGLNCYLNESYCYSQNQIGEKSDISCLYGCTDGACNKSSSSTGSNPAINMVSPNGGETWQQGSTQNITWQTTGDISGKYVKLFLADGLTNGDIGVVPASQNNFSWTINSTIVSGDVVRIFKEGSYKVKAVLYDKQPCFARQFGCVSPNIISQDSSDNYFTITAPVAVAPQDSLSSISGAIANIIEEIKKLLAK